MRWSLLSVVLAGIVAGCQHNGQPALSVDEARKIQAEFQGQASFVPPPRSISDIAAILEQYRPDPGKLEAASKTADAAVPSNLAETELAEFYYARAQAAAEIGRRAQQLADAREAVRLALRARHRSTSRMQQFLGASEMEIGNFRTAVEWYRSRLDTAESFGQRVSAAGAYATVLARLGALDQAQQQINSAKSILDQPSFSTSPTLRSVRPTFEGIIFGAEAVIAASSGRYDEAERAVRLSLNRYMQSKNSPQARNIAMQDMVQADVFERLVVSALTRSSGILVNQGRLLEAEAEARKALLESLQTFGRYSPLGAASTLLLAQVVYEQGRYAEAARLTEITIDTLKELGAGTGSVNLAEALMLKGRIEANRGERAAALQSFLTALDVFANDDALRARYVEDEPSYGATLLAAGEVRGAVAVFERLTQLRRARFGERHYLTAEARGYLGAALAKNGEGGRALGEFQAALPLLLQTSRQSDDETSVADRDRRLQDILEAYIDLLSQTKPGAQPGLDPAAEAFRIADAARARGVQRALAASAARASIRDDDLARLVRQEQDARKQIAAQFGLLTNILASPPDQQDPAITYKLREQIDKLRQARAALRQEIERRFPDYANLIDPRPASVADVQKFLGPGEALLSIYVGKEKTFVWAVPPNGSVAFAAVAMNEEETARAVAELRRSLDPNAATLGDIPPFDVGAAHRLYAQFVEPVSAGLAGADSLLLVPDKAFGQLPFGLLVTQPASQPTDGTEALFASYRRVPFLIRRMAVTQLPSVAALATLRKVPTGDPARRSFAGFGDPWFNADQAREAQAETQVQVAALATRGLRSRGIPLKRRNAPETANVSSADIGILPRLPDTAEEVRSIAAALRADPATDVFLGTAANEAQVKSLNLADRKVVMFATHGLVPGDLNGLAQPALALSAPDVAKTDGDGLLTMEEILGLRLDADWVVLSACNTGAADGAGAEAASGLGRAFFYAGTRAVLLTNWPVETTSARALTTDLFRRQAEASNLTRARAMQQAMLAMIDNGGYVEDGKTLFSYAHPIFWAPFSVVGDGRGSPGS